MAHLASHTFASFKRNSAHVGDGQQEEQAVKVGTVCRSTSTRVGGGSHAASLRPQVGRLNLGMRCRSTARWEGQR
jgi:hypothetical protein